MTAQRSGCEHELRWTECENQRYTCLTAVPCPSVHREVRTLDPHEANIFYVPVFIYGTKRSAPPSRRTPRPLLALTIYPHADLLACRPDQQRRDAPRSGPARCAVLGSKLSILLEQVLRKRPRVLVHRC